MSVKSSIAQLVRWTRLFWKAQPIVFICLLFFIFNLSVKSFQILSVPPGQVYDEIIYVAEAQAILKYGTDLTGNWHPWQLEPSDSYYTELTSTVLLPGFFIFPNHPLLASKTVPLLAGSLLPVLLALIGYFVAKKRSVLVATALVATLNPWLFQFSRTGFDSLFSIFFYLLGIVLLLYGKDWQKLWSLVAFFLGFFQYQGHKPLLVPYVTLTLLLIVFSQLKKCNFMSILKQLKTKQNLVLWLVWMGAIAIMASYLVRLPDLSSGVRMDEFSLFEGVETRTVDEQRRLALSNPMLNLMDNKYTLLFSTLISRFLYSFDLNLLFQRGNPVVDTFAVIDYGYFHLIDLVLLASGLMFLGTDKKIKNKTWYILAFILVGTIPSIIRSGTPWIIFRNGFAFVGMVLLAGYGLGSWLTTWRSKAGWLLISLYLVCALPFFYLYFIRFPVTYTKNNSFYERILASYVQRQQDQQFAIIPDRVDSSFNYLLTYNKLINQANKKAIYRSAQTQNYQLANFTLYKDCPTQKLLELGDQVVIVDPVKEPCIPSSDNQASILEIKALVDSGTRFRIYNDRLCNRFLLTSYPNLHQNKFAVEKLSDEDFCTTFFSR